jgi:hypothetical protein
MTGFWAGSVPPWAWVLYVAAAGIFLILVIVAELHGRKVGRQQEREDRAAAELARQVRSWRARSAEVLHPPELHHELVSPAGYLRGLDRIMAGATTNLARDPDDPYDPDEDAPFTVVEEWSVPLEYPPAPEPAFPPWSLLDADPPTLLEDVRAMCANAEAAPSVRWLAELEDGQ